MKTQKFKRRLAQVIPVLALTVLLFTFLLNNLKAQTMKVKNVVLVHGAFADGSGWKGIYEILSKKGYNVTIVQNPLSSLEDDVAATNLALDKLDGPAILAGHSWGGAVISEAGNHPKVAGSCLHRSVPTRCRGICFHLVQFDASGCGSWHITSR